MRDECDASGGYAYHAQPYGFLVATVTLLQRGKTLCLSDESGHNAAYLASLGYEVLAIDSSSAGLSNVMRLARAQGLFVETQPTDWADLDLGESCFENIVSMFCHVSPAVRRRLHLQVVRALRPGGMLLLAGFRPEQCAYRSGGPKQLELLMKRSQIEGELAGLEMIRVGEVERRFSEGPRLQGCGAVLEIIARKPHVHHPRGAVH